MAHRVADQLVARLAEAGVERIYGVVGDSLNPLTDALRLNNKVKWIHVRNEEAGAFAAGAEAQLTGKLAAAQGAADPATFTSSTAFSTLIAAMLRCWRSHRIFPAVKSAQDISRKRIRKICFKECSHYCELITNPAQFERVLHIAMQTAIGKAGVSVIALPGDVVGVEVPAQAGSRSLVSSGRASVPAKRIWRSWRT